MDNLIVLSVEQALSLTYATQRFVHLGWRVIRLESTPSGNHLPGDPNRYVGKPGDAPDRAAYFVGPNVGKESITLNLKQPAGREALKRLIAELPVDVFTCNTLPKRYVELGIDYDTLSAVHPGLIWVGLSAMGPRYPFAPGYDPALQALAGYMELTGDPQGPPVLCGVPFVDLKAGDEVFAAVCLALAEKERTGNGQRIDVSMLQAAASWLITSIPLVDLGYGPAELRRNGSEHREFVPVNVYPTADGYCYLAIGNDAQWERLVSLDRFARLASPNRKTNEGRRRDRASIHAEIASITSEQETSALIARLTGNGLVAAPINTVHQAMEFPPIRDTLLETRTPSGHPVRLPPPSIERKTLAARRRRLPFAPRYGESTDAVLTQAGFSQHDIDTLRNAGTIA